MPTRMRARALAAAVAVGSFAAPAAFAQQAPAPATGGPAGHWSLFTGETVSPGRDALDFELGWPGATFGYLHGLTDRADVGVKFDLLYGLENTSDSQFGMGLRVPLRLVVNRQGKLTFGLHVEPGLRFYTGSGFNDFVIRFPVGGSLGIQATPELRLAANVDLTMGIQVFHVNNPFAGGITNTFMEIGPQFGAAAEYQVDKQLLVGLNMMFGPQFYTLADSNADFAFTTEITVGYRF